jgi:hypothetical protein
VSGVGLSAGRAITGNTTGSDVFIVLPAQRLTWVVGAIHGNASRLVRLHDRLATRITPRDNLVYLGNFLGGGGHVAATVHEMLLFRRALLAHHLQEDCGEIAFLRGCQEEMWHKLLQMQFAPNPLEVFEWMLTRGIASTIQAYGGDIETGRRAAKRGAVVLSQWTNGLRAGMRALDGHDRLISVLRRAAFTADRSLLLVNAGVDPSRPLSQQGDAFWWGNRSFEAMDAPYEDFAHIVRGFDAHHRGLRVGAHVVSLDGGCGFGGPLLAGCFDGDGSLIETLEA